MPSSSEEQQHAIEEQLLKANEHAGKSYAFDEVHDELKPADWWFQQADEGLVLFAVFYTQACRWSLCTGCNLPSVSSQHGVGYAPLAAQIDALLADPEVAARKAEIAKVIVSNNGSVLDEVTFPSTALMYLLAQLNLQLPAMKVLSMETRVEYVDMAELEFLSRAMSERDEPAVIELAVGFEAFDDHIRNKVFLKGMSLESFEELVRKVAEPHFRLKCYFMQKPVATITDEEAVRDVQRGIDYLSEQARSSGVDINMHLNPTYVAKGTALASSFADGDYTPPQLRDVARAVLHAKDKGISLFVGLYDEGLAVDGGSFIRDGDDELIVALEAFNRTQDFAALEAAMAR